MVLVAVLLWCWQCLHAEAALLQLLTIVPFPSNDSRVGWSQGLELVPAGLLALKHINDTPDLLSGHTLQLVVRQGEGCGSTVIVDDIYSLCEELSTGAGRNVVGVVGLPCSTATGALSKIAGHSAVDLIQISGSTSTALSDSIAYPRLYLAASSAGSVASIISFMRSAGWRRISVFHDEEGLYFQTLAELLVTTVRSNNMTIDNVGTLTTNADESIVMGMLNGPGVKMNKITVVIGTEHECSVFMCAAYKLGRTWPGYVYILPDRMISDFNSTNLCDLPTVTKAIEGAFTVGINLEPPNDAVLVSGKTYSDYKLEYLQELKNYSDLFYSIHGHGLNLNGSIYANNLYDEIWSFALALNSSQQVLSARNLSFENFRLNPGTISDILEEALLKVDFQGAGGRINFKYDRAPITSYTLYQISNGNPAKVAAYNGTITISENFSLLRLPSDSIEGVFVFDPIWLTITVVSMCVLCLLLIMFNAGLLLWYRKERDIKASSPYLSLLMFIGCTMLSASVLTYTFNNSYSNVAFTSLCNVQMWLLGLGTNLIINTLFVRLFRPNDYRKGGRVWRDENLFLIILLLTSYSVMVLLIWTVVDPYRKEEEETYIGDTTPPYFEVKVTCVCRFPALWLSLLFMYTAMLTFCIMLFATHTRNIKRQHFKDTKKVNIFVFTSIITLAALLPLWELLGAIQLQTWAHLAFYCAIISIPTACQVILYVPKTFPHLCHCCFPHTLSHSWSNSSNKSIISHF